MFAETEQAAFGTGGPMKQCPEVIQLRMVWHFWHCDPDYVTRVAKGAGIDLDRAKALPPLEGKPAPGRIRKVPPTRTARPKTILRK